MKRAYILVEDLIPEVYRLGRFWSQSVASVLNRPLVHGATSEVYKNSTYHTRKGTVGITVVKSGFSARYLSVNVRYDRGSLIMIFFYVKNVQGLW